MQFALVFDSDTREHIIEQVFDKCLPEVVSEEKTERMEIYLGTTNTIWVYLREAMLKVNNVCFGGNWDILQWDVPEFYRRND